MSLLEREWAKFFSIFCFISIPIVIAIHTVPSVERSVFPVGPIGFVFLLHVYVCAFLGLVIIAFLIFQKLSETSSRLKNKEINKTDLEL
jgi:hypothetical protein